MTLQLRPLLADFIVAMISIGLVLFKLATDRLKGGVQLGATLLSIVAVSLLIYGIATLGWGGLRTYMLSPIHSVMALLFIFVLACQLLLFDERGSNTAGSITRVCRYHAHSDLASLT